MKSLGETFIPEGGYLWVSRGSMLHIEGQCLGIATFSDQMSRIQSHILVQNLVVLFGSGGTAWAGSDKSPWVGSGGKGHVRP